MRYVRAFMLGITLIAVLVACSSYIMLSEIRATASDSNQPIEVQVEQGDTTTQIATKLRAAGLIRQPLLFTTLVRMQSLDGQLQAGRYMLQPSMTMHEILVALQYSRVGDMQVTIPEGLRLEEIADRLAAAGLADPQAFLEAARNGDAFREDYFLLGELPAGATLEGYLFPDTYRIALDVTPDDVVRIMLDRFVEQYATIERTVQVPGAGVHDIVTMASIVQREAAQLSEMPQIAAVFWNRLDPANVAETGTGRLQADPTVQYALGYSEDEQTWWQKNLTVDELAIDNPYNTREQAGLPPGPISAPGMDALRAAAQPDQSAEYLYFVADCALDGTHNFAVTFEEFQQYEAEFLACSGG